MAMFVLVVDTSIMNVSISAVVHDLHTDVSSVQTAIALEALVSAAFILIGSKVGDLIGRKRAYVLGLLGYAIGAIGMTLAQSVAVVIVFWALVGGLGASLLLPAMQSLIHGNFEGKAQTRVYAQVGAAPTVASLGLNSLSSHFVIELADENGLSSFRPNRMFRSLNRQRRIAWHQHLHQHNLDFLRVFIADPDQFGLRLRAG